MKLLQKQENAIYFLKDKTSQEVIYGGAAGGGKAQPITEPILTPNGWVNMGDIKTGDEVIGSNGRPTEVIAIHPQGVKDVYKVTMIDGAETFATGDHLWYTWQSRQKKRARARTTLEVKNLIDDGKNMLIPFADPMEFSSSKRGYIHPYIIGVLLGDGSVSSGVRFISGDNEIAKKVEELLPDDCVLNKLLTEYEYSMTNTLRDEKGHLYSPFKKELTRLGVNKITADKFVPKEYLNSTLDDRIELIKGLMDTDGTIDSRGHASFTNTSKQLVLDMQYLIRSIGGKATLSEKTKFCTYKGEKKYCTAWELYINTNDNRNLFYLPRKKNRVKKYNGGHELPNRIVSIEHAGEAECQCITVDSKDSLYVTRDFILTHNSALGCLWLIENCQLYPGTRWLMGRSKLKTLKETTLNTFFELASKLNISNQFRYNGQENIIYWNNGSQIILKDLFLYPSDPEFDKLGSLEITGAFIDECSQLVYKAWQIVKSRIRFKLKEYDLIPKMLGTCNPTKNWVYKEFYQPNSSGKIKKYRRFITALPKDNHHLPESYLESLLSLDKNSRERLYYGNWEYDDDPSALISFDAITDYFNPVHISEGSTRYLTIDVARKGKDKTVFRIWKGWLCVERFEIKKSGLDEVVKKAKDLMRKYKIPLSCIIADEDGVGGGVVDFLWCKGFVNNSRPLRKENFANLKTQCSYYMAQKIEDREVGEICNSGDIRDIVGEEMEQIKQKDINKDGKIKLISKDEIKTKLGRSPDDWDSIMMRYYFELNPIRKTRKTYNF